MPVESEADRAVFTNADEFGVELVWEGAALPIPGLPARGTLRQDPHGDGPGFLNRNASVKVSEALIPPGAAAGEDGDEVTFGSQTFTVVAIEPDGTGFVVVRLEEQV